MLPDYPTAKEALQKIALQVFMKARDAHLLGVQGTPQHEGHRAAIRRQDGSSDEIAFRRHGGTVQILHGELPTLSWTDVLNRIAEAGDETGGAMFEHMIEEMDHATKKTGMRIDAGGKLTPETYIEMVRMIDFEFDERGDPHRKVLLTGQKGAQAALEVLDEIENDPDLRNRHDAVMREKREQWRDRESCRKLVE